MYATRGSAERVNWEVLWISKGTIHSKEFEHDLASALELRDKLIAGERQNVTLRSMNMGFPPPDRYADRDPQGNLIIPREYEHRMALINLKGLWWCSYCLKLRRFEKTDCFVIDGIQVDEPAMSCPLCGASNRLNAIQKYNPKSLRYTQLRATRSDKGSSR